MPAAPPTTATTEQRYQKRRRLQQQAQDLCSRLFSFGAGSDPARVRCDVALDASGVAFVGGRVALGLVVGPEAATRPEITLPPAVDDVIEVGHHRYPRAFASASIPSIIAKVSLPNGVPWRVS